MSSFPLALINVNNMKKTVNHPDRNFRTEYIWKLVVFKTGAVSLNYKISNVENIFGSVHFCEFEYFINMSVDSVF